MELLVAIVIGVLAPSVLVLIVELGGAARKRSPTREISKEEAMFFYKQGFYKQGFYEQGFYKQGFYKQGFEYAWKRYQELFKKGQ